MAPRVTVVDGNHFTGVIDRPGPPQQAPPETAKREPLDERMAVLVKLLHDHLEDESARTECQLLILARFELNKKSDAFFASLAEPMRQKLIDQHEELKRQGREAQAKIEELRGQIADAGQNLNNAKNDETAALNRYRAAQQRRNGLSRFASRAEILKADTELEAASERLDKANAPVVRIQERINRLRLVEMQPLLDQLSRISQEEIELDAAINGTEFTDSLGIIHPARS